LVEVILSEEIIEHQFSDDPAKFEFAVEWSFNIIGGEGSMGYQVGLLINRHEELQPSRLHKEI
jgi:hypothetical protein